MCNTLLTLSTVLCNPTDKTGHCSNWHAQEMRNTFLTWFPCNPATKRGKRGHCSNRCAPENAQYLVNTVLLHSHGQDGTLLKPVCPRNDRHVVNMFSLPCYNQDRALFTHACPRNVQQFVNMVSLRCGPTNKIGHCWNKSAPEMCNTCLTWSLCRPTDKMGYCSN